MSKTFLLSAIVAVSSVLAAHAADSSAPTGAIVLLKKDIPINTVYAWERWGNFINAVPGDGKEIPYDAAKLQVRVYAFPSGQIRIINFDKSVRTHNHVNMTDTILYTWTGRRVLFANDQAAVNGPGDAAFHPKGVFHHGEAIESGKGIEFAMEVDKTQPDPQPTWLPSTARPFEPAATWMENGQVQDVVGTAAAGANAKATRYEARTFDASPYYVARELRIPKGATLPMLGKKDRLMFVLDGKVTITSDAQSWELSQDDAARAPADHLITLKATQDSRIIEAYVPPKAAPKIVK